MFIVADLVSLIYSFAVKSYSYLKGSIFSVLKIGFHGDRFVAREHNTNGMFHLHKNFEHN